MLRDTLFSGQYGQVSKAIWTLTVKRYSTARSGLLNAARIARSICALSKPMLSMSAIAAFRWAPRASDEGSEYEPDCVWAPPDAGVGVSGAAVLELGWAGAAAGAGAAGVVEEAGAGVEGAFAGVEEEEVAAGAVLGCQVLDVMVLPYGWADLLYHADNEALFLNLVWFHGVGILQNLSYWLSVGFLQGREKRGGSQYLHQR
jgi:hypothetical protein